MYKCLLCMEYDYIEFIVPSIVLVIILGNFYVNLVSENIKNKNKVSSIMVKNVIELYRLR